MKIDVYRDGSIIVSPNIDSQTQFTRALMGAHKITCVFKTPAPLGLQIGDYIVHADIHYKINQLFEAVKDNSLHFTQTIDFEAPEYDLANKRFKSSLKEKTFDYFGTPLQYLELIIANISQLDDSWAIGTVDSLPAQTISFDGVDCKQALTQIAEAFKLEFQVENKTINLQAQVGNATALSLQYGQGNGLYKITRKAVDDSKLVTRLWGYGGTQNIDLNYRGGARQLQFEGGYLEHNTDLFGIIEDDFSDDTIFPHYTGTVTAVDIANALKLTDSGLDFDINAVLMAGVTAQVVFKTGSLAGSTFDIASYDNDSKTITFNTLTEQNDYALPNDVRKPTVGDTYTLVNLAMSPTYISNAETALQTATQSYLDKYSQLLAAYDVTLSRLYMRRNNYTLHCANTVHVADTDLGIDADIRITQITYPMLDPFAIELTISDTVLYDRQTAQVKTIAATQRATQLLSRTSAETARQNAKKLADLKDYTFDSDGKIRMSNFAVGSIDTRYLNVGAVSENFNLSGVIISCNVGGDPNVMDVSAGNLLHNILQIEGLGSNWAIPGKEFTDLTDAMAYYLYAKCSTIELTGSWELSADQKVVDSETGYYWFWIGMLYAVADDQRDSSFTYGVTTIIGDRLTVGTIQSLNGKVKIGLTDGTFQIGDAESGGMDWNVSAPNTATFYGGIVQRAPGITAPMAVWRGVWSDEATYYNGDQVTDGSNTYTYINATSTSGHALTETDYWAINAAKGETGASGNFVEYRFAKNGSPTVAPDLTNTDAIPTGWSITQPASGISEYVWITSATKTATGALVNNWSAPSRLTGRQGDYGPILSFLGEYDNTADYYGTPQGVVAVRYTDDNFYVSRTDAGSFSNIAPTDTSKWTLFGTQLESVATGLLLAEEAYIENLTVGKLSTGADNTHPYLKAAGGEIDFWDEGTTDESDKTKALVRIGKDVGYMQSDDTSHPGISARDSAGYTEVTSAGVFSNGSDVAGLSSIFGTITNFSVAALLQKRNTDTNGISAAVFGIDQTSTGNSKSYGGWFNSVFTGALYLPITTDSASGSYFLNASECVYSGYYTSSKGVYLDPHPKTGRIVFVKSNNAGCVVWCNYNSNSAATNMIDKDGAAVSTISVARGDVYIFIFDGSNWLVCTMIA